jgi:DNA topoisomerase I
MLDRIRALAIPPAWEDVWICANPLGHIQATGVDARGIRKKPRSSRRTAQAEIQGPIEEAMLDLIDRHESPALERVI